MKVEINLSIKGISGRVNIMVKAHSKIPVEKSMLENGRMGKNMVKELIDLPMETCMSVIGRMEFFMVMELTPGQMEESTLGHTMKGKEMVWEK